MHTYTLEHMPTNRHTQTHTHTRVHTYTTMHAHIHTHKHTHTHANTHSREVSQSHCVRLDKSVPSGEEPRNNNVRRSSHASAVDRRCAARRCLRRGAPVRLAAPVSVSVVASHIHNRRIIPSSIIHVFSRTIGQPRRHARRIHNPPEDNASCGRRPPSEISSSAPSKKTTVGLLERGNLF